MLLVIQVFVLQGLHHLIGHHHDDAANCDLEGIHFHAEGHEHFSCDICLFNFAPTDLETEEISIQPPPAILSEANFSYQIRSFAQTFGQTFLRGPPAC